MQLMKCFPELSEERRRETVSMQNPENPFAGFVGNEGAVKKLLRLAFCALGDELHFGGQNIALLGPAGVGKTTLAKCFAKLLDLPFVEADPGSLSNTTDLFNLIAATCEQHICRDEHGNENSLKLVSEDDRHYVAPSMIVFIDEVHLLSKAIQQGLLKATEPNDSMLATNEVVVDTSNITWIIATTELGKLFHAFRTRFSQAELKPYTRDEIAEIILRNCSVPRRIAEQVSRYAGSVTREAIDFANEVIMERKFVGCDWEDAVESVRKSRNIDEYGMSRKRLMILEALGKQTRISIGRLPHYVRVQSEELTEILLPPLLQFTDERDALVTVTSRGCMLTAAGKKELERRNIQVQVIIEG